jgi:hypothetical protein
MGPVSYDDCVISAKKYTYDETRTFKLAGRFLEQEGKLQRLELEGQLQMLEGQLQMLEGQLQMFQKMEALYKDKEKLLIMDALRSRGLLSSRGVFERILQLVHSETKGPQARFVATETCRRLDSALTGMFFPLIKNGTLRSLMLRSFMLLFQECGQRC